MKARCTGCNEVMELPSLKTRHVTCDACHRRASAAARAQAPWVHVGVDYGGDDSIVLGSYRIVAGDRAPRGCWVAAGNGVARMVPTTPAGKWAATMEWLSNFDAEVAKICLMPVDGSHNCPA